MNTTALLTDIIEKLIFITLLGLSVWSVSIIIDRRRRLRLEKSFDAKKLKTFLVQRNWSEALSYCGSQPQFIAKSLEQGLLNDAHPENVERAISSYVKEERQRLERGLSVLGTLGANAPFIGLLGTVLGIIRSFASLSEQNGSQAVMSGVSQALYATAIGLFVAIPAVISFNIFSKQIRELVQTVDSLKDLYIAKKF